jgi:hypothetical protein
VRDSREWFRLTILAEQLGGTSTAEGQQSTYLQLRELTGDGGGEQRRPAKRSAARRWRANMIGASDCYDAESTGDARRRSVSRVLRVLYCVVGVELQVHGTSTVDAARSAQSSRRIRTTCGVALGPQSSAFSQEAFGVTVEEARCTAGGKERRERHEGKRGDSDPVPMRKLQCDVARCASSFELQRRPPVATSPCRLPFATPVAVSPPAPWPLAGWR